MSAIQALFDLRPAFRLFVLASLMCLFGISTVHAATLPTGFAETRVATGLASPTAMTFAPDGRLFVAQQGGALRVIKNGALLSQPFLTVSVNSSGERGLLGVAFDPNFASNNFVYVYYTTSDLADSQSREPLHGQRRQSGRRSRGQRSAVDESAEPELGHESQRRRDSLRHRRQALHRGGRERQQRQLAVRSPPTLGKLLRINADGTIPSDNPFLSQTTGINQAIWARGLRNPFNFAIDRTNGRIHLNDVGQDTWEEVNHAIAGANFGWPQTEGQQSAGRRRRALSGSHLSECRHLLRDHRRGVLPARHCHISRRIRRADTSSAISAAASSAC